MKVACDICHKEFTRANDLQRHKKKLHVSITPESSLICSACGKTFSRKFTLQRHQQTVCGMSQTIPTTASYQDLVSKIKELESKLERTNDQVHETKTIVNEIKDTPKNVLQVICITPNDNYIEMLTDKIGNFDKAIDYIKDCALSDLAGDCKLIERIYDDDHSLYLDKRKSNVIYYNEKKERIMENKDQFGRKLANNLQNSYLKGVNYLINKTLDKNTNPNKLLDEYDIASWNRHIYNLSDQCYQRKIINQLNISNAEETSVLIGGDMETSHLKN